MNWSQRGCGPRFSPSIERRLPIVARRLGRDHQPISSRKGEIVQVEDRRKLAWQRHVCATRFNGSGELPVTCSTAGVVTLGVFADLDALVDHAETATA